ncbi:hypothetical protein BEK98_00915 [Streptomyces diastatochromogenes]|uniref:Uncharacterized protein n=1 Tax=Streptomyces diastatochromogenes TaxID=42236 RepID=A0A233SXD6_STRDA|nr:hypothetical protein BEK98_00915 [Streptomyces diastatochromogenes]
MADRVASIEVQAEDAALLCLCAPLAALSLLRRMYHQFGWDMEPLTTATQDVLATWQRVALLQPEEVPATFRPEQEGLA